MLHKSISIIPQDPVPVCAGSEVGGVQGQHMGRADKGQAGPFRADTNQEGAQDYNFGEARTDDRSSGSFPVHIRRNNMLFQISCAFSYRLAPNKSNFHLFFCTGATIFPEAKGSVLYCTGASSKKENPGAR